MPKPGSTTQRGYGSAHQALRRWWRPQVDTGTVNCWRCKTPIHAGQHWDLGHFDGSNVIAGPEHRHAKDCEAGGNRATKRTDRQGPLDPPPNEPRTNWSRT